MSPEFNINIQAPMRPKNIPIIFLTVIFSLMIIAEVIITKTGLIVIMMAAFIGVVRFNPSKKNS